MARIPNDRKKIELPLNIVLTVSGVRTTHRGALLALSSNSPDKALIWRDAESGKFYGRVIGGELARRMADLGEQASERIEFVLSAEPTVAEVNEKLKLIDEPVLAPGPVYLQKTDASEKTRRRREAFAKAQQVVESSGANW